MKTLDDLVMKFMRGFLWVGSVAYSVKVYGLENVEADKAAVFAVKHSSNVDLPVMLQVLPQKVTIFATRGIFTIPITNYFLKVAGVVPIYKSIDDGAIKIAANSSAYRAFYNTLSSGGWVVYAPEARRVLNAVGEEIMPQMILKAAKLGHKTYLVGIRYANSNSPWLSWLPGKRGIDVRIEPYDAKNKTVEEASEEVKETFARLSGISPQK